MQNLLFLALLVFGVGLFGYGQMNDGSSIKELITAVVAAVGGGGGLVYNNGSALLSMFKWPTGKAKRPRKSAIFSPQDYELEDQRCLVHLRERLEEAGSTEGVELCSKLNSIVFGLESKIKEKKRVKEKNNEVNK